MKLSFTLFFVILIVLLVIDSLYLYSMKGFFDDQIVKVQGSSIKLDIIAVILCYISLTFGLHYFILRENKPLFDAFILGIIIYAVYETTTKSLLKNWNYSTVLIDTLWGGILFALTTFVLRKIYK